MSKKLTKVGLTIRPRATAASTAGGVTRGSAFTVFCTLCGRECMHATAGDTDGDESISNLPHDDSSVRTTSHCCADGSEFGFPVRSDLVFMERMNEGDEGGRESD